eukprot:4787370-Pyramimonas_sp.AAC.1
MVTCARAALFARLDTRPNDAQTRLDGQLSTPRAPPPARPESIARRTPLTSDAQQHAATLW